MALLMCSAQRMSYSCRAIRNEVYIAAVPLRGPAQFLFSTAIDHSLNLLWDLQHFMVLVKPVHDYDDSSSSSHPQVLVYDFQPHDPENIFVAVTALSGRKVPGVIVVRKLSKVPKKKCWFVGYSRGRENASVEDAVLHFNEKWETDLRIGHHDCRNYCQGLVEYLTDEKFVLEDLRDS